VWGQVGHEGGSVGVGAFCGEKGGRVAVCADGVEVCGLGGVM
jgi:hypothetical protein